jgi:hypothetical protein
VGEWESVCGSVPGASEGFTCLPSYYPHTYYPASCQLRAKHTHLLPGRHY